MNHFASFCVNAAASTCHRLAAALISMTLAAAPACRIGSQNARIEVDPPVIWSPASSGCPIRLYRAAHAPSRT